MRPLNVLPSITWPGPSGSRAPRCRLLSQPRRRPWPHSAASTTRSSVWRGLTFSQPAPRRPGGVGRVERLDEHALVAAGERVVEHRARRRGVRRDRSRHPRVLRHELGERLEPLAARAVDQVLAAGVQHVEEQRGERGGAGRAARVPMRLAVTWNGSGRPSARSAIASPSSTAVSVGQRERRLDDLGHARGDVVERAREHAHVVAAPVHLHAHAVELELDRRRADPLERGVEVVAGGGEHRLHRAQQLERDPAQTRPRPPSARPRRPRRGRRAASAPGGRRRAARRPPSPPRRSSRRRARPGRCRPAAARRGSAARPRSRARTAPAPPRAGRPATRPRPCSRSARTPPPPRRP